MKHLPRCAALALLLVALTATAYAAPPAATPDAFLARLAGDWNFVGTVLGKPVRYHGSGHWVLNDAWLCLSLIDQDTPSTYQASVYLGHDAHADDYIAHWLDKFGAAGARVLGSGRREGNTLVLLFPYQEGTFRDTLTLPADGASGTLLLESQHPDGHWSTFASYRLTRVQRHTPARQ
jgi:hypothetical protein